MSDNICIEQQERDLQKVSGMTERQTDHQKVSHVTQEHSEQHLLSEMAHEDSELQMCPPLTQNNLQITLEHSEQCLLSEIQHEECELQERPKSTQDDLEQQRLPESKQNDLGHHQAPEIAFNNAHQNIAEPVKELEILKTIKDTELKKIAEPVQEDSEQNKVAELTYVNSEHVKLVELVQEDPEHQQPSMMPHDDLENKKLAEPVQEDSEQNKVAECTKLDPVQKELKQPEAAEVEHLDSENEKLEELVQKSSEKKQSAKVESAQQEVSEPVNDQTKLKKEPKKDIEQDSSKQQKYVHDQMFSGPMSSEQEKERTRRDEIDDKTILQMFEKNTEIHENVRSKFDILIRSVNKYITDHPEKNDEVTARLETSFQRDIGFMKHQANREEEFNERLEKSVEEKEKLGRDLKEELESLQLKTTESDDTIHYQECNMQAITGGAQRKEGLFNARESRLKDRDQDIRIRDFDYENENAEFEEYMKECNEETREEEERLEEMKKKLDRKAKRCKVNFKRLFRCQGEKCRSGKTEHCEENNTTRLLENGSSLSENKSLNCRGRSSRSKLTKLVAFLRSSWKQSGTKVPTPDIEQVSKSSISEFYSQQPCTSNQCSSVYEPVVMEIECVHRTPFKKANNLLKNLFKRGITGKSVPKNM